MHKIGLMLVALLVVAFVGSQTQAAAPSTPQTTGCNPPPGSDTAIVCYGATACPAGYLAPYQSASQQLAGLNPLAPNPVIRTLCEQVTEPPPPDLPPATPVSSAPTAAATVPASILPTAVPLVPLGTTTLLTRQIPTLGMTVLTDQVGLTLYVHATDTAGVSACTDQCATVWPPLQSADGNPTAPSGVSGALGVMTRDDGSQQVTYNGMPLYHYSGDLAPGDAGGQGISILWSVATP